MTASGLRRDSGCDGIRAAMACTNVHGGCVRLNGSLVSPGVIPVALTASVSAASGATWRSCDSAILRLGDSATRRFRVCIARERTFELMQHTYIEVSTLRHDPALIYV